MGHAVNTQCLAELKAAVITPQTSPSIPLQHPDSPNSADRAAVVNSSPLVPGSDEERCHATRLLALLGQHPSTHQVILQSGALPVVLGLLRDRGHTPGAAAAAATGAALGAGLPPPSFGPSGQLLHVWQAAQATYNMAVAAGMSSAAASTAAAVAAAAAATPVRANAKTPDIGDSSGMSSSASAVTSQQQQTHTQLPVGNNAQGQPAAATAISNGGTQSTADSPAGSTADSTTGSTASSIAGSTTGSTAGSTAASLVGPSLVLEQAVGVACMLSHNPDNHFVMVGEGLVPLLVTLLHKGGTRQHALCCCQRCCCSWSSCSSLLMSFY